MDEGISGEVLDRPGLTKMRESVDAGIITVIVCYDPDRLSRKLMHQLMLDEEFRKKGVELIFVNGEYANTAEGQLFKNMRGAIAEFEKEKIKQRTKGGKLRKAREGKVLGNYGLYGYDFDHEKKTYIINEEQAEIVRSIFNYFTEQRPFKGINGIANYLTSIGIPTAKGNKVWHRQVVRQILLNISYTGKHPHNKYDAEGDYVRKQSGQKSQQSIRPEEEWIYVDIPALITKEQFNLAQELLSQSRRRFAKESLNQYLLSGLIRCSDCGNTMVGRQQNNWGKQVPVYSDEKTTSGAKNKGCRNRVKVEELDNEVWKQVLNILDNPEEYLQLKQQSTESQFLKNEIEKIEKELEKNKKGRKRLLSLVAMSDQIDLSDIKEQIEEIQNNENTLQQQYNQFQKELKALGNNNNEVINKMIEKLKMKHKKNYTFEAKKEVINSLVKQIYVSKEEEVEIHLF
jgi:site-specific DNA recombinase